MLHNLKYPLKTSKPTYTATRTHLTFPAMWFLLCFFLSLQVPAIADDTIQHYPPNSSIVISKSTNVLLSCNGTSVVWSYTRGQVDIGNNATVIQDSTENIEKIIDAGNSSIVIKHFDAACAGIYRCTVQDSKPYRNFDYLLTTFPLPSKSMKYTGTDKSATKAVVYTMRSENVAEGKSTVLECYVEGYPTVNTSWWMRLPSDDESASTKLTNGTKYVITEESVSSFAYKTTLTIPNLATSDRKDYICAASNANGMTQFVTLIRVKDKLAPLWPAIGIFLEFVVVGLIIVLCERHRKKVEEREDVKSQ